MRTSPEVLGRTLAAAPDPDLARLALSRVGEDRAAREALEDHLPAAAALLGFSTAAADFLSRHPGETADVLRADPRTRTQLLAEAEGTVARLGPEAGLRRFRRRALWRLATRDLLGAEVDEVVAEMTGIAEACLEVAAAAVRAPLAIIGMGKLGGAELNYASDVDVIFVHGDDPERGAAAARRLLALLSAPTADGVALRVDTDLRPEGRAGPLTRSAPATLEYYRRHAATWERQALLKARSVAGERGLGERLLEDLASVIYPERIDPGAIDDVRGMKVRIEEYVRARGKESTEVKRGRGGIRDVEFAVQLLQMVHGRRDPALRTANTLAALAALGSEGYVAVADAVALADS
ncbi:MAG TPA: bifunctional glutamine-synthetase adenylyltransferase/deadenyltransferase, partial [Actinomycetota bacterium]|nr:bifunctional glutamine-synthetase adenylyltransferase/deadenyltransferase [Actinomycetota bacterium]